MEISMVTLGLGAVSRPLLLLPYSSASTCTITSTTTTGLSHSHGVNHKTSRLNFSATTTTTTPSTVEPIPTESSIPPSSSKRRYHSKSYLARQSAILHVQQSPDFDHALSKFGDLLKVQDLNAILRHLGKLNRFQDLSKLFEYMQHHGKIDASTYSSYIKATGMSGNPSKALEIYIGIRDPTVKNNVVVCNCVLSCLVQNGKLHSSLKLFHQMKQDGLRPDIVTYSTLLSGCTKAKDGYSTALELAQELKENSLQMDGVIYGTLLAVCASNNQCEKAEHYFEQMKDEGHIPNEFHYSSLLNAYSADGNYKKAENLVRDMKSAGLAPNKVILTTLLKVYVRGGLFERSRELLSELDLLGYAKDEMPYCLLMDGLAKAGRTDEAKSVFDDMMKKSVKSDGYAYSIMISAFYRSGLLEEAKLLARDCETKYNKHDLVMLNTMLCAYCRAGEMQHVMQTLKRMDELAVSPDYNTFHILVKFFYKERLYLLAYKTLKDMHSKGHQLEEELSSSLIFRLGRMKAYSEAFSVYSMLRYSKRTICKALHEKILHILIAGRLHKEAYVVVKDNGGSISKVARKKFAMTFLKSGNINMINDVIKVIHSSGDRINQDLFKMAISRFIVQPRKKELLLHLLQWMPGQGYVVDLSTRDLILKNAHYFGKDTINEALSKHQMMAKTMKNSKRKDK